MKANWKQIDNRTWVSKVDPRYTVEIGTFEDEDEDGDVREQFYVYPAFNRTGIPNSPDSDIEDLSQAENTAQEIMRKYNGPDLKGFEWGKLWTGLTEEHNTKYRGSSKVNRKPGKRRKSSTNAGLGSMRG